jgi:hypothetical protein
MYGQFNNQIIRMLMFQRLVLLIGLFSIVLPLSAQLDVDEFRWDLADLAFSYPASWDEPFAVQRFGVESVFLAESDSRDPERAPEVPIITLTLRPAEEADISTVLQEQLAELDLQSATTIPTTLLDEPAVWTRGNSRDGLFFGMGISLQLKGNILSIVGRVPSEQTTQFQYIFDVLTRSLVQGGDFGDFVPFGIIWNNSAGLHDGDTAFTDLRAIALDEPNQHLYALDSVLGVLQFDLLSGRLEAIIQNIEFVSPNAIAISPDNTMYIADSACRCIHVYDDNEWQDPLTGFAVGAPVSILTTSGGNLYATDSTETLGFVRQYNAEGTSNLFSEDPLEEQPILFSIDGVLHILNQSTDQILALDGIGFTLTLTLDVDSVLQYIQVASDGTYIIADDAIIDLYTPDSLLIDTLDINDYSLGSIIRGLVVGSDDTIYIATIGDNVGEVLALSQRVDEVSIGLQTLAPYRMSSGFLNENNTEDIWLLEGTAGEIMSLFVQGYSELSDFQYSMTLIAPDKTEIVTIDEDRDRQPELSRGVKDYELSDTGLYEVRINHLFSQGSYDITLITTKQFTLDSDVITVWGELSESYSQEMWAFEATAGTTVTITVKASNSTQLDPHMTLYDSQYNLLAQNDDAEDTQLGNSAQIQQITLSRTGLYYVDALRLDGEGKYSLTVEIVEPEES